MSTHDADAQFISEPIQPVPGTGDARAMARGEPGLPARFIWRDRTYTVTEVMEAWKSSGPERGGGGEIYLRRHWHKVRVDTGETMTLYCERQARNRRRPQARWFLYTRH